VICLTRAASNVSTCRHGVLNELGTTTRLQWKRNNEIFGSPKVLPKKKSNSFSQDWSRVNNPNASAIVARIVMEFADIVGPLRRLGHSTRLIRARVLPSTQWTYAQQLSRFIQYLVDARWISKINPIQNLDDLDAYLVDYAEIEVEINKSASKFGTLLSCIQCFFPDCKGHLNKGWSAFAGWKKHRQGKSHPPLPEKLLCLAVQYFIDDSDMDTAAAIVAMSAGYLRGNEACSAKVNDYGPVHVTDSPANASTAYGVFTLSRTKSGRPQSALIRDEFVHNLLIAQQRQATVRGYTYLFNMSSAEFRRKFDIFISAYKLRGDLYPRWVPHSIRHGAATYDFIRGVPFADIKARGRWTNDKVVHVYLQSGEIALNRLRLPSSLPKHRSLQRLCNTLRKVIDKCRRHDVTFAKRFGQ